jgi:acyl-CoA synthetase (AMP-forming)/AMP-acid ligase II
MPAGFLLDRFREKSDSEAVIWNDRVFKYRDLLGAIAQWEKVFAEKNISAQSTVAIASGFSLQSIALLLALFQHRCIAVVLSVRNLKSEHDYLGIAQAEYLIHINERDDFEISRLNGMPAHEHYQNLKREKHPGLVLFSSGSSGMPKAAVHNVDRLLTKYQKLGRDYRTLTFLMFDHIGGLDTLLYSLSNTSCVITLADRSPEAVCGAIERYKVQVLPVSPSFLNLLLISKAYVNRNFDSLVYVTYGTEPMPESTLRHCSEIFPKAQLLQKYGTTEVGTLRSASESSDSLWVKLGGEQVQLRVVNGQLEIKSPWQMLGYLNAPDNFTEDGWFITGDKVEQKGEYFRILGRDSELINVGGEKVFPAEVEQAIEELDNIGAVVVFGEKHPLMGNIVCAKVNLIATEPLKDLKVRITKHCKARLEPYKVPMKVMIEEEDLVSERFKKKRK